MRPKKVFHIRSQGSNEIRAFFFSFRDALCRAVFFCGVFVGSWRDPKYEVQSLVLSLL